jgi:type I restriction enzyme S subunit
MSDDINWFDEPLKNFVKMMGDGGTPSRDHDNNFGGNTPWVVISDIQRNIYKTRELLTDKGFASCTSKLWPANSVILSTGATIGKLGISQVPLATKQGITGIVPNNRVTSSFLYYELQHKKSNIVAWAQGSTFAEIRVPILEKLPVRIPKNISIQSKIVNILETVDIAIEKAEELIEKYQQIKTGLMQDLFTRGIGSDGNLRPPCEQAPELYYETKIGWIPKDWRVYNVKNLALPYKGSTVIGPFGSDLIVSDYRNEGTPIIFVRDVKEDCFKWVSDTFISKTKTQKLFAHRVKSGDILATKMGLPPCVSCLYPESAPLAIITADMIRLSPDLTKVNAKWLSAAINEERTKKQVAAITAGVTRPKVTLADFRNLKIAAPEITEQQRIMGVLSKQWELISIEEQKLEKLIKQKNGLMNDLLTGKKAVSLDDAETACV